jgi:hypothetical protein
MPGLFLRTRSSVSLIGFFRSRALPAGKAVILSLQTVAKVKGHSVNSLDSLASQIESIGINVAFSLPIVPVGEDPDVD